jgi:hypothetical protein
MIYGFLMGTRSGRHSRAWAAWVMIGCGCATASTHCNPLQKEKDVGTEKGEALPAYVDKPPGKYRTRTTWRVAPFRVVCGSDSPPPRKSSDYSTGNFRSRNFSSPEPANARLERSAKARRFSLIPRIRFCSHIIGRARPRARVSSPWGDRFCRTKQSGYADSRSADRSGSIPSGNANRLPPTSVS